METLDQRTLSSGPWSISSESEMDRRPVLPLHAQDPADVAAAFRQLSNLRHVAVTFCQTPSRTSVFGQTITLPASAPMARKDAIKSLNVLLAALQEASTTPVPTAFGPIPPNVRHSHSHSSRSDPFSSTNSTNTSPFQVSAPVSAAASAAASVASTRTSSPVSSAVSSPSPSSPPSPSLPAAAEKALPSQSRCHLTSFSVDRLPFELFRNGGDRRIWFQCRDLFAGLTHLNLALDTSEIVFPQGKLKAVNGLSYILRKASQVKNLSLAFHNHAVPRTSFILPLQELFGDAGGLEGPLLNTNNTGGGGFASNVFRFNSLTDFKLEGVTCDENELRGFLLQHAATLERLRLGGRGLARGPDDPSMGGIRVCNGTIMSLFHSLRGRLPRLERVHLEGLFYCETESLAAAPENVDGTIDGTLAAAQGTTGDVPAPTVAVAPPQSRLRYEYYQFRATTDDDWTPATEDRAGPSAPNLITSAPFEAYLLGQLNEYPGQLKRS